MTRENNRPDCRTRRSGLFSRSPNRRRRTRRGNTLLFEELEHRSCPSLAPGLAAAAFDLPVDPNVSHSSQLAGVGAVDLYQVTVDADGLFVADVQGAGFSPRLSLLDGQGDMLIQSEASSTGDSDNRVAMHLTAGAYFVMVQDVSGGGSYTLGTSFTDALPPSQPLPITTGGYSLAVADLNGDKIPDLVAADFYTDQVQIYLGVGDGTFQPPVAIPVGFNPAFVTTADLTGDGIPDIITANTGSNDLSILLGNGDGTFQPAIEVPAGLGPSSVAAGDFNGDGHLDLAVTDEVGNDVQILLGQGDGTFTWGETTPTSVDPSSVVAADFDGDGRTDLAVVTVVGSDLTIFQGRGDGTFTMAQQLPTGAAPTSVIAADFNGDGQPDLAVVCADADTVMIFQNRDGRFISSAVLQTATYPYDVAAADFSDDGRIDLAVSSYGIGDISVFMGNGDGTFQPEQRISVGASITAIAAADLAGDGRIDLVTVDVINQSVDVLLGTGDGEFQMEQQPSASTSPPDVVAADLTGNGIQDLIIPDESTNELSILLGRGDGTFRSPMLIPVGLGPWGVAVGDFNGDGIPDLAVTNRTEDTISILLGTGDGEFRLAEKLITGIEPSYITSADLDGDGHLDLVESNFYSDSISIFYGNGDGTFQSQVMIAVGSQPGDPVIADFNGDGRPDIATAGNQGAVAVLLATGRRTYAPPESVPAGPGANWLAAGDLNGDGKIDLVVADTNSFGPSYVTVLLGKGDGTFSAGQTISVGSAPFPIDLADLNGDGKLDIITGNLGTNDLTLLLGRGDGTFQPAITLAAGSEPFALAVADFNDDGKPDIAVADYQSGDVTVLLNLGGGMFGPPEQLSTAASRIAMVTADFDDDGQLDLAIANPTANTVTILLGTGDGTFTAGQVLSVGIDPSGLVVGDFNGDGRPDLAVADAGSDDVMVFLGLGDGTFASPFVLPVGQSPNAIVTGDFLGNGITDIAVANELSNDVSVLIGNGHGRFLPAVQYPVGAEPVALLAADLSGDGLTDLVTANRTSGNLTILWGLAGGGFSAQTIQYGGQAPSSLAVGDFDGDGRLDLAVGDEGDDRVSILRNLGDQSFEPFASFHVGVAPQYLHTGLLKSSGGWLSLGVASIGSSNDVALIIGFDGCLIESLDVPLGADPAGQVLGDFNGDGITDVAFVTSANDQVIVRFGSGQGHILDPALPAPLPQAAPIVVDWNDDGTPDVFDLDDQGNLLVRLGQPGSPGEYQSPQIVGQYLGVAFQDIALVNTAAGPVLAALERSHPVVWLFSKASGPGGLIGARSIPVPGAAFLVSMAAGDLDDDGLDDLVLVDRGNDQVIVLDQAPDGTFSEQGLPLNVGYAPSEVAIADIDGNGWPDLVVSNTYSGDISVFYGGPGGQFGPELRLAAGLGAAVVVPVNGGLVRHTTDLPIGVTTGVFDSSGLTDIVSVQSGADRISLLDGTADGAITDPSLATTYSTGSDPIQVVAVPLTKDGLTDLVVLNQGSDDISIFLNDGKGGFITMPRVDAGNNPAGVAVRDVNGDGIPDLLVSNDQGDLLIILGNGNGTFEPYERADQTVSLAEGDFGGNGQPEYVLSNTSIDQLSIEYGDTQSFVQGRDQGLQAPGAVAVADLNGDGNPDIIVINKGENDILIYLGLGGNAFQAPLRFFTGTDPEGLTVADLTGNGVPDLIVANAGSNDLSLFIGVGKGANWKLLTGPRLRVGDEPVSTTVADLNGDGFPDIISVDEGSDNVVVLTNVGDGFFDDSDPLTLPTGQSPIRAFVGKFDDSPGLDLAVLNSGSNDLTYYSNFIAGNATPKFIPSGGEDPVAGVIGDFNADGYNDLAIANNGDNLITLFEGGPDGLILVESDFLDQSVRPTDLLFSGADSGEIHLYVSAEGRDDVISVTLTLVLGTSVTVTGGTSAPLTGSTSQAGSIRGALVLANGLFSFELMTTEVGSQDQGTAAAAAPSGGSTAATGQGGLGIATLLATLDQVINLSSGTVPGVINNLVQLTQVQISDLMPLENSAMESVAVLLVVSGTSAETANGNDILSLDEALPGRPLSVESARSRVREMSVAASNLERFLSDLDGALDSVPRDLLGECGQRTGQRPRWFLRPSEPGMVAVSVSSVLGPAESAANFDVDPAQNTAPKRRIAANRSLSDFDLLDRESARATSTEQTSSDPLDWLAPFCGALVVSSVYLGWRGARNRWWAARSKTARRPCSAIPRPHLTPRQRASQSSGSRARRVEDLPPWLARQTPSE